MSMQPPRRTPHPDSAAHRGSSGSRGLTAFTGNGSAGVSALFRPESVCTRSGPRLIENFVRHAAGWTERRAGHG
ncbi:hypothetical protein [Streptomyces tricolor]|uniref:hypothetical protein n=1 Tax=Streptomyces tricolor TaxID=68277 RepID=UPI003D732B14